MLLTTLQLLCKVSVCENIDQSIGNIIVTLTSHLHRVNVCCEVENSFPYHTVVDYDVDNLTVYFHKNTVFCSCYPTTTFLILQNV